ncbi:MAG TPA: glucoamylase family protein [Puia sp.]|nr:glucoamylase family protein [Puia sp.]
MMKVTASTVFDILSRLRVYFQGAADPWEHGSEEPFRSELYSSDQLNSHGKAIASSHQLQTTRTSDHLLKRLADNESTLLEVRNLLVENIKSGKPITPGAEWLVDNFYLIEEQVVLARKHLPKGYSEALPALANGLFAGMPRVYDIVLEIISHSDGRVDAHNLGSFVAAYQTTTELTLGELWAIPIMLRLAVIENLRRVCGRIALDMIDHNLADYWADKMIDTVKEEAAHLILTIADMVRSKPPLSSPFVAGFTRSLQGKGPALALPLSWLEQQLSGMGTSSNDLVRQENQKQAADQVSVRNSIGTLRFIGTTEWREFVEKLSCVEQVLVQDPAGTYPRMDFSTRDRYRHVVESIAKNSGLPEKEIAEAVLALAGRSDNGNATVKRSRHVGFYLIDKGLKQTLQATGIRRGPARKLVRMAQKTPFFLYFISILLLTCLIATGIFYLPYSQGIRGRWLLSLVALLAVSASAQLAVSLVNWLSTLMVKPKLLPRMDFSKGIPAECRTLVIVPTLLSGKEYIESLMEGLEIRFLANKGDNLHFGLLTDFMDANAEIQKEDEELTGLAIDRIEALNQKYKQADNDIFFLFHRARVWNPGEQKWMGYERKRGKLTALNALLRGRGEGDFSVIKGDYRILYGVKYVITLDSDTLLPRDSAWKLVAAMAHPLNQAEYNTRKRRVTEGYGVLQPRVDTSIPVTTTSLYLHMQGSVSGIDPYTRVTSDVYQDLFEEGSFIGKGIYDVDIFELAFRDVFQENRILSHDLLEGCYVRSGLLSDVFLYEENPAQYESDLRRHHRWIRGDWQIAAWILPYVRTGKGHMIRNRLSALSRWKIFDNLRRSLLPVSLLSLLLLGWFILPFPWFWTLAVSTIILLPPIIASAWQLLHKPADLTLNAHVAEVIGNLKITLIRFVFGLSILPYEAFQYLDAILRALWRMIVSRRKLLEWTPSATISLKARPALLSAYRSLAIVPLLALVCTGFLLRNPQVFAMTSPILLLWFLAPALVWRLSKPGTEGRPDLTEEELAFLHKTARKTWAFFEQFVIVEENWLPPDNFQETEGGVIAHRTSPTNIGLALLANLAAYDFGYLSGSGLLDRCGHTFRSMHALERFKGHFYNWYDTKSLSPLYPRYISTVDSGNLAGHLLTLRQGFLALPEQPLIGSTALQGCGTTAAILLDQTKERFADTLHELQALVKEAAREERSLTATNNTLKELAGLVEKINIPRAENGTGLSRWVERLSVQVKDHRDHLQHLVPWTGLLPVPDRFARLAPLDQMPTLRSLLTMKETCRAAFDEYEMQEHSAGDKDWLQRMQTAVGEAATRATERIEFIDLLAEQCEEFSEIEYDFLLEPATGLLHIGYNVEDQRKDNGFYDLLASEVRLGIFVGIAQGKLPQESWFALGRLLTDSGEDPILLSWSGSMFEYLMPQLVMPSYENTLLAQTSKATVRRQIEYAGQHGTPWGISESAYNLVDANLNYQYRAFGIPGLGLNRGLEENLVVAPYASMLALMILPEKAVANLQILSKKGLEGEYGFYEAVDYTASRLPRGKASVIIQSFMVHHEGMGLLSLAYVLLDKPMQQRFAAELRFQATLLLLQERIPRATLFYAHTADMIEPHSSTIGAPVRIINTPHTRIPEIQLLSNGRYQVMISNSGAGYSRWKDISVTRWREDATKDDRGIFCYIKDVGSGNFWSNTFEPTLRPAKKYEVIFSQGHIEFRRRDNGINTNTEIVISPEDDTEMRRIRITNTTLFTRVLEVTSYAEVVLAGQASDEAHPAFSNLFVQTEILPEYKAVVCTRRPRSEEETPPWMFHLMNVHGTAVEALSYETARSTFIGRGRNLSNPQAMDMESLSGSHGAVLDPIVAIRYRITVKPNHTATVDLIYGISETREACEGLIRKYRDEHLKNRAFELSWTHNQVLLRQINATEADAQLYDQLASSVIYPNPDLRGETGVIMNNFRGQSGLWSHSVSGDLPIVLLHMNDPDNLELARQMIQAHAYWRLKGLSVDLVIWNEDYGSYRQQLQDQIQGLISTDAGNQSYQKPGKIFVRSADQISPEDRILFESVARVIIYDHKGTLSEQVHRIYAEKAVAPFVPTGPQAAEELSDKDALPDDLLFDNGTGGFTRDGKEYKILTDRKRTTPAPWVNVIANPDMGTVISESGSAYTWVVNAHEYRLTPWSNDPVSDAGGEAFYLRDEESGYFWSPAPFPVRGTTPYITTHGFGYSRFQHTEQGISTELCQFIDQELPVKWIVLRVKNQSGRRRKFSATGYLEIVLGDVPAKTSMHILSEQDADSGALVFRNRYNTAFSDRVTFFKVDDSSQLTFTTDRLEFIGRNRNLQDPQAMHRKRLSGRSGAGMDPCAALQVSFDLPDGAEKEVIFLLGSAPNIREGEELIRKLSGPRTAALSLDRVKKHWGTILGAVQLTTPDDALNIFANGWLLYQTLSCRLFGRSGFYQSGGAFGFRDQLQDVLAILHTRPDLARQQILLHASRQFAEGDVQHWWHPPEGRGVRTRCSDDYLWLPFVVARYVAVTGDGDLLEMPIGYLEGRPLHDGEESFYDLPVQGNLTGTLYEHCARAIRHGLRFGRHGLPLMGTGDWNDGMDKVGYKGAGESIWLAFFLYDVLMRFADTADTFKDHFFAEVCRSEAAGMQSRIETAGWDGEWYRRAYFDDGTPLGSKENKECRIDAISQSWAVLSGSADAKRAEMAMTSLEVQLVRKDLHLIQLLDPPFDSKELNPGYIKGYLPGVRENGGQYTHAAVWTLMAFAALGQREKLWRLLELIHPINHATDAASVNRYKTEPYVMAADVYANKSHEGMGGWTWYTGSAGWMYQFIVDSFVGLERRDRLLTLSPCFPLHWPSIYLVYRYGKSEYRITIFQVSGNSSSRWKMGVLQGDGDTIILEDDGQIHSVEMYCAVVKKRTEEIVNP